MGGIRENRKTRMKGKKHTQPRERVEIKEGCGAKARYVQSYNMQ